ncbi:MAG: NAD(P)-dependent oxidoreductase [Patescibacteria group bacterium]
MMNFKGKKVLVAGYGLIGTPLVKMLIEEEGAKVRVASLNGASRAHPGIKDFFELDLMNFENCFIACDGMDYVFNLLCLKGSPQAMKEKPATFFDANILLDLLVLRAAHKCGVGGYLLASSLAVYPPAEVFFEDDAGNEKLPSKNDIAGGLAKLAGEFQARFYAIEHGMLISTVRPANTYGPFDDFDSERAMVVPSFIRRALGGENPFVARGASQFRDVIYSEDVARGMIHVAKLEEKRPVNLGSGTAYSFPKILGTVLDNLEEKPEVVWQESKSRGDSRRVLDISRAKSLGWNPKISLEEGIKRTMEWYSANKK